MLKLEFQKQIANSQFTLPVVCVMGFVLWFALAQDAPCQFVEGAEEGMVARHGIWSFVPSYLSEGMLGNSLGAVASALAIYLMAELNNTHVLLRVSSRMLSSMLALLTTMYFCFHTFQPGNVIALLVLAAFFMLFSSYQQPLPILSFSVFLTLSVASLICPQLLYVVPVYWVLLGYLRAFSFRCVLASLMGLMLPYWFYAGVSVCTDSFDVFLTHVNAIADFEWFDYCLLDIKHVVAFAFVFVLFVSGAVDFYRNSFLDKTRTRVIYNAVIIHGIGMVLLVCLQPQHFHDFMPILLVDTAIVYGHFVTLTHTLFTHIYCTLLFLAGIAVGVLLCS